MSKNYNTYRDAILFQMPVLGHDDPENIRFQNNDSNRLTCWLPEHCDYQATDLSPLAGLPTLAYVPAWLNDETIENIGNAIVAAGVPVVWINLFDAYDDYSLYGNWQHAGMFKFELMEVAA